MNWDLSSLIKKQTILDQTYFKEMKCSYATTVKKRKLAIIVEISELANEIRFFKFWSKKPASNSGTILSELVDVLHFALTFIIHYNGKIKYQFSQNFKTKLNSNELTQKFLELINCATIINDGKSASLFVKQFLKLCFQLNFTKKQILEAYDLKNKINFQRIDNNY